MNKDYRNTKYCSKLENVHNKKNELQTKISEEHPKVTVFYNQVKVVNSEYNNIFRKIYNYKCAYCGNSISNITSKMFETDHFICESSFDCNADAGQLPNLVLSCYECNRGKGNLIIEGEYKSLLNPDNESINTVFKRNNDYKIEITKEYAENQKVKEFYNNLKFGFEFRRLDYLLLNMKGLLAKIEGQEDEKELAKLVHKIQTKRNLI